MSSWTEYQLTGYPSDGKLPESDITAVYLPGLLAATERATRMLSDDHLELLPVVVDGSPRSMMNSQLTVRRCREDGAEFIRAGNAVIVLRKADFFAEDVPVEPSLFWFHDGNTPRYLLCNEAFVERYDATSLTGLEFSRLGAATRNA
jgi:hypothetical protein